MKNRCYNPKPYIIENCVFSVHIKFSIKNWHIGMPNLIFWKIFWGLNDNWESFSTLNPTGIGCIQLIDFKKDCMQLIEFKNNCIKLNCTPAANKCSCPEYTKLSAASVQMFTVGKHCPGSGVVQNVLQKGREFCIIPCPATLACKFYCLIETFF